MLLQHDDSTINIALVLLLLLLLLLLRQGEWVALPLPAFGRLSIV